jgi:very-short-patch-repair endonuclease
MPGAVIVIVIAMVVAYALSRSGRNRSAEQWPVFRTPVLSESDCQFYARLVAALPEYRVFPQVQISRFIEVRPLRGRQAIRDRYSQLSADFVICDQDFDVKAVVELDDSSHGSSSQQALDAKKNAVVAAAGILMVRCHVSAVPPVARIREQLLKALSAAAQGNQEAAQAPGNSIVRLGAQ